MNQELFVLIVNFFADKLILIAGREKFSDSLKLLLR